RRRECLSARDRGVSLPSSKNPGCAGDRRPRSALWGGALRLGSPARWRECDAGGDPRFLPGPDRTLQSAALCQICRWLPDDRNGEDPEVPDAPADDRRTRPEPAGDRVMTRIASVTTHMISVPRPFPVWTAHEESKAWNVILTEVRTDDGLIGYGEIHGTPMPRICEWVSRFSEIIRGMDALAHIAVWEKLFALTSPRPGGIEGRDGLPPPVPRSERAQVIAAIAGIDIALWDIKAKAAGLPVYRLLGGENRPIFTYATGGYYRPNASDADYGQEL